MSFACLVGNALDFFKRCLRKRVHGKHEIHEKERRNYYYKFLFLVSFVYLVGNALGFFKRCLRKRVHGKHEIHGKKPELKSVNFILVPFVYLVDDALGFLNDTYKAASICFKYRSTSSNLFTMVSQICT